MSCASCNVSAASFDFHVRITPACTPVGFELLIHVTLVHNIAFAFAPQIWPAYAAETKRECKGALIAYIRTTHSTLLFLVRILDCSDFNAYYRNKNRSIGA